MIRFCKEDLLNSRQLQKAYKTSPIMLDGSVWEKGRAFFKYNKEEFCVLPISDSRGEILCFAYQDDEANRELRMIQELRENKDCLKFSDVFPDNKCVTIIGCNELAYCCAEYLSEQGIEIKVIGDYWDLLGYSVKNELVKTDDLYIYAEGVRPKKKWYHNFLTSVSVEFECIDRIYEENLLCSKIRDIDKSIDELLSLLRYIKNIVIIGDDISSQDTYDFLLGEGIEIYGFLVEKEKRRKRLFGKPVLCFDEEFEKVVDPVFIQCDDKNSALGSTVVHWYDYHGYKRNKNLFVIKDYIKIPDSNLINVLKDKKAVLLGDYRLCRILEKYLTEKTHLLYTRYVQISDADDVVVESDEIVLLVKPLMNYNARPHYFEEILEQIKIDEKYEDYTDYFSRHEAFAVMDEAQSKYPHTNLRPKGILLGKNKGLSGSVFLRGILDGHPNIFLVKRDFCFNIFWYCIRLADVKAEDISFEFWEMYEEENAQETIKKDFPQKDKFIKKIEDLIEEGMRYTAQEIFVLLHIAYSAMWDEEKATDISQIVLYWEPHIGSLFPESLEPASYFARWLESDEIEGHIMNLCRNAIIRGGSHIERFGIIQKNRDSLNRFQIILFSELDRSDIQYKYWKEFFIRFEDIKLNPKIELEKICHIAGIPWSDTLLQTTDHDKIDSIFGVTGFDLNPVYNVRDYYLSAFDRMKIALGSAELQKMYGYPSVSIMNFSRRELQEMFLKLLRIQSKMHFSNIEEYTDYILQIQQAIRDQLWKVRKSVILQCLHKHKEWVSLDKILYNRVLSYLKKDIYTDDVVDANDNIFRCISIYQDKISKLMSSLYYIKYSNKIIMYGIGRDAEGLLKLLNQTDIDKILFGDIRALNENITFYGKKVITLHEMVEEFCEYPILITSSYYAQEIEEELLEAGINKDRIKANTFEFGASII